MKHPLLLLLPIVAACVGQLAQAQQRISMRIDPDKILVKQAPAPVITIPEGGETHTFIRDCSLYQRYGSGVRESKDYGSVAELTVMADGTVYLKNPIAAVMKGYFVGHKQDDKYVFDMPQSLVDMEDDEYIYEFGIFTTSDAVAGELNYTYDAANQQLVYTLSEDGSFAQAGDYTSILGIVSTDDTWYGYGEYGQVFTPMADIEPMLPPENIEPQEMRLVYNEYKFYQVNDYNSLVKAVFDGSDVLSLRSVQHDAPDMD